MYEKVKIFNEEIIGIKDRKIGMIPNSEYTWLKNALDEEALELDAAFLENEIVLVIDALVDTVYFALGGLARLGLPTDAVEEIFDAVHMANMAKECGRKVRDIESDHDAIKPKDWQSPEEDIRNILSKFRYAPGNLEEPIERIKWSNKSKL